MPAGGASERRTRVSSVAKKNSNGAELMNVDRSTDGSPGSSASAATPVDSTA